MDMQYSPKLKRVMEKIKGILIEEDIEGIVIIHHEKWSEILNHFDTTNSCAKIINEQLHFKIDSKKIGEEKAKMVAENTFNFISHFSELMGKNALNLLHAHEILKKQWNGKDLGETFTSNTTQQN